MATVNELFRRTQQLADDSFDNIDMLDWFNQCQDNLLDIIKKKAKITIEKNAETGLFDLPSNYSGNLVIEGYPVYEIIDNTIRFDEEDNVSSIKVKYERTLRDIENIPDSTPELPKQFHDVYIFYACMMAMLLDEEPERYAMYEREYLRMRGQIELYTSHESKKPDHWTVIR